MDVNEALEFVDELIHDRTGKHLNDLERQVFLGSWQGQTYEEIYPYNPEYIEKDVGYKLWRKLSNLLPEKVTKKNFRGAIERSLKAKNSQSAEVAPIKKDSSSAAPMQLATTRVLISYHHQEPDASLAWEFYQAIEDSGAKGFMFQSRSGIDAQHSFTAPDRILQKIRPGVFDSPPPTERNGYENRFQTSTGRTGEFSAENESYPPGQDWLSQIEAQLKQCDYFLLLLSPQAAVSEMAIELLRRAKELRDRHSENKPILLPIRVNCPANIPLNHDLRCYLEGIVQREWNSPADTPILVQEILSAISGKDRWGGISGVSGVGEDLPTLYTLPPTPPPLPVAEPELPSGQVRLASAFYVERVPYEVQCYREIAQPGALIRIKAPRQMGKTSLMARVLYYAKEELGYRTVPLSFQHADTAVFTDLNQLLRWFCARISRKLRLTSQLDDYWTDTYGSKDNCTIYFEDCLLAESDSPLVLGLDEVDRVFQYPKIADDFFGLLRAWYEEAGYGDSDSSLWEKLRLVVVHSTEVYIPLNVHQSPFNVGLPIELPEFTYKQVQDLTQRHALNLQENDIEQLMSLVGGHPYLVRLALYHMAQQQTTLKEFLETAPTEAGFYDDHLRRHLWSLQQHPELAAAFAKVVTADTPIELDSVLAFKLHSMGLVKFQGNQVIPRFDLYRIYFADRL